MITAALVLPKIKTNIDLHGISSQTVISKDCSLKKDTKQKYALKNLQFLPNHYETLKVLIHEYRILTKFHNDWV